MKSMNLGKTRGQIRTKLNMSMQESQRQIKLMSPAPKQQVPMQSIMSNYTGAENLFSLESNSVSTSTMKPEGRTKSYSAYKSSRSVRSTKSTVRTSKISLNTESASKQPKSKQKATNEEKRNRAKSTVPSVGLNL